MIKVLIICLLYYLNPMSITKQTIAIFSILLSALALSITLGSFAVASVSAQGETKASIVSGASTMGDKAYSPNPVNIKVGDTITWTNKDSVFHTVTSGTGPSDPSKGKEFDSGLSGPNALTTQGKTFSHKFMTAGEFPYFCEPHPTMVGKVVVS
jgi:plastocyanin